MTFRQALGDLQRALDRIALAVFGRRLYLLLNRGRMPPAGRRAIIGLEGDAPGVGDDPEAPTRTRDAR